MYPSQLGILLMCDLHVLSDVFLSLGISGGWSCIKPNNSWRCIRLVNDKRCLFFFLKNALRCLSICKISLNWMLEKNSKTIDTIWLSTKKEPIMGRACKDIIVPWSGMRCHLKHNLEKSMDSFNCKFRIRIVFVRIFLLTIVLLTLSIKHVFFIYFVLLVCNVDSFPILRFNELLVCLSCFYFLLVISCVLMILWFMIFHLCCIHAYSSHFCFGFYFEMRQKCGPCTYIRMLHK